MFKFNGKFFTQSDGLLMSSPLSHILVETLITCLDNQIFGLDTQGVLYLKRYENAERYIFTISKRIL